MHGVWFQFPPQKFQLIFCQSSEATNFLGLWLYVVGLDWRLEDVTVTPLLLGLNGNLLAYLLTSKRAGVLVVVSSSDPVVSLVS